MDAIRINPDPIKVRYIVVATPDPSADEVEEYVPPADRERATAEVRSAVNRLFYGDCG